MKAARMATAVAQPRPASPAGAAAAREVWEMAEPPNFHQAPPEHAVAAAAYRGPEAQPAQREGEAAAAARVAAVARAALARAPPPPYNERARPPPPPLPDPVARRRVNANIHLSLTTEFATLVGEAPTSFPCPSRRRLGPTLHVSLQPEFAELLGLDEDDDDDDDDISLASRVLSVSFSDEEERPRSAGSTWRPASPASVVSEDIEADATWCGNWRSRRAAPEDSDEMDVTSLRTALALARREATAARADAAAARRHARRRSGAARADSLAARRAARDAAEAFDAVAEAATAAAQDASRARSNQAAAEAAHAAARAQLRRATTGDDVFVDNLDALETPPRHRSRSLDAIDARPPSPPLDPRAALAAAERVFLPAALQPLSTDCLADLDRRLRDLGDAVRRKVVDRALCGDEASTCALCCAATKSVAFVDCGHAVCETCVAKVDRCPFCRGPAQPSIRIHL